MYVCMYYSPRESRAFSFFFLCCGTPYVTTILITMRRIHAYFKRDETVDIFWLMIFGSLALRDHTERPYYRREGVVWCLGMDGRM